MIILAFFNKSSKFLVEILAQLLQEIIIFC
jgi:hypothetical protein